MIHLNKARRINFYAIKDQQSANPAYRQGMELIKKGNWEYGFYLHELRSLPDLRYPQGVKTQFAKTPVWIPGMECKGKNAIVWSEAGWGDMLQFSRFIPLLRQAGLKSVKLLFPDPMIRLLKRLPNHDGMYTETESFPNAVKIKVMSLPYFLMEHNVIPAKPVDRIYGSEGIYRNPEIVVPKRDKPLLGYCYTTTNNSWNMKAKQMPQETMLQFIEQHPEFDWVSLQEGEGFLTSKYWSDTANQIQTLDGVISVDSAIAHCAGSVGVPVVNLIGQEQLSCWRWYPKGETTYWYDSMKTVWFDKWEQGLDKALEYFQQPKKVKKDGVNNTRSKRQTKANK
jgi:hypothetical protein